MLNACSLPRSRRQYCGDNVKITRVRVFKTALPYVGGEYRWGRGNVIATAWSMLWSWIRMQVFPVVGILPAARITLKRTERDRRLIAPRLLGPEANRRHQHNDGQHHPGTWLCRAADTDILGKSLDVPVWMLLGGKQVPSIPMYRVAPSKALRP